MTPIVLLGGLLGVGLTCIVMGARKQSQGLAAVVAKYDPARYQDTTQGSAVSRRPPLIRAGSALTTAASRLGHPLMRTEDLMVLGRTEEEQLAKTATAAILLGIISGLIIGLISRLVVHLPFLAVPLGAGGGLIVGALLSGADLRRAATRERDRFNHALGCWLELVALAQAGGMGIEGALQASCSISSDRSFLLLSSALEQSQLASITPWQALGRLGREVGISQLVELASTLSLAGNEGARIRTSLVAKSASLRQRQMSKAEGEANSTTERLFLPSIVLMLAFMVFLMYPAAVRLAHVF